MKAQFMNMRIFFAAGNSSSNEREIVAIVLLLLACAGFVSATDWILAIRRLGRFYLTCVLYSIGLFPKGLSKKILLADAALVELRMLAGRWEGMKRSSNCNWNRGNLGPGVRFLQFVRPNKLPIYSQKWSTYTVRFHAKLSTPTLQLSYLFPTWKTDTTAWTNTGYIGIFLFRLLTESLD